MSLIPFPRYSLIRYEFNDNIKPVIEQLETTANNVHNLSMNGVISLVPSYTKTDCHENSVEVNKQKTNICSSQLKRGRDEMVSNSQSNNNNSLLIVVNPSIPPFQAYNRPIQLSREEQKIKPIQTLSDLFDSCSDLKQIKRLINQRNTA